MLKRCTRAVAGLTLIVPLICNASELTNSTAHAQGTVEKTVPQGEDPPGVDDEQPTAPLTEQNGVIKPPPIGDEEIHTDVPNPDAGHDKEVIPPPGTPGGNPNVAPH
jgi:hypothetical protein